MGLISRGKEVARMKLLEFWAMLEFVLTAADHRAELAEAMTERHLPTETRVGRAAQTATVLSVVTIGITAILGILIYSQVSTSLPQPQNQQLQNASNATDAGFADAMQLIPVVLVVLVASVVLGIVQRLR